MLAIVLSVGAVVLIAWGILSLFKHSRENILREVKEPSKPHEANPKLYRRLKEL
jgi:hypothetical protein